MNDQDPSASSENRLSETESSLMPRGLSPGAGGARLGGEREAPQKTGEPKQVKIVLRIEAVESQLASVAQPAVETPAPALPQSPPSPSRQENEPQQIPARMLNEFVYCQRLFYYEFVEGVFVESVDTLRGDAIHQRVDSGNGALPAAKKKAKKTTQDEPAATVEAPTKESEAQNAEPETIHSRSVQMGSERLGVVAKMDLVESKTEKEDLFTALEVCPVDYKAGAPKEGEEANELWDTDKMQLGLQALILRDNGYTCNEGVIYYRATKQRVRLPITPELENWILQNIAEAKRVITGPIPAPLIHSPKCVRCSLAPVCLPDETRMLAQARAAIDLSVRRGNGHAGRLEGCGGRATPQIDCRARRYPSALSEHPGLSCGMQGRGVDGQRKRQGHRGSADARSFTRCVVRKHPNLDSGDSIALRTGNSGHLFFDGRLVLRNYTRPRLEERVFAHGAIPVGTR